MGENSPEESMDLQASSEKLVVHDESLALPSSSSAAVNLQNQVKKPTRQWAAWTRQEEENFFNALRQVGKNFEKITCRVQSKNKDQVRHYYYRLVRRMNKLLGPEFCLDAKNSKDTIAAMLRWWSLLEKYSCTASKLHLKPRRFKTFIEALAHQLLKDRNKTRRKRSSHQENNLFIPPTSASIMTRGLEKDMEPVKLLFLENQKMQKVGYASKSSSLKGNNVRTSNNCGRGGLTIAKSVKQNRRTGIVATAAYRRWEKAALAGVSLVADAAEQLERTSSDRKVFSEQTTFNALPPKESEQVHDAGVTTGLTPSLSSGIHPSHHKEIPVQPYTKLKLQLFPIDENTRKALEKDDHNPFLELTLSARKRISSIIEHLNCKWGKSSVASGELMLFPYDIPMDNLVNCQRWSLRDKVACAADIYGIVGKPNIFRLRYGWVSCLENESKNVRVPSPFIHHANELQCGKGPEGSVVTFDPDRKTLAIEPQNDNLAKVKNVEPPESGFHEIKIANTSPKSKNISPEFLQTINSSSLPQEQPRNEKGKQNDEENLSSEDTSVLFAGEWADSLTNISIGDLLSEASRAADSTCNNQPGDGSAPSIQDTPFSCDSFDAVIAAHISGCKGLYSTPNQVSHVSIWDAEETCDGLSFKKNSSHDREDSSSLHKASSQSLRTDTVGFHGLLKNDAETQTRDKICYNGFETKSQCNNGVFHGNYDNENNLGLMDAYWPDSLGADLDIPTFPRYLGQDMIFGDSVSLGGLSRLIANSLDAFQNLSCGSEKRPPSVNLMTSISSEE